MSLSCDSKYLYALYNDGSVISYDCDDFSNKLVTKLTGDPKKVITSRIDPCLIYVMMSRSIFILKDSSIKATQTLKADSIGFEVNEEMNEIYVGDNVEYAL